MPAFPSDRNGTYVPAIYAPVSGSEVVPYTGTEGRGWLSEIEERWRGATGGLPTMFRTRETTRAVNLLEGRNPVTGRMHYWRHMGRPILFSGDVANCRRVGRVQARLNRARPRKR